jgi:4-hydroxy 2-oxovalerate aldolase
VAGHGCGGLPDDVPLAEPAELARQAKPIESYGANCVYVTGSGDRLTMHGVRDRLRACRELLNRPPDSGTRPPQPGPRRRQHRRRRRERGDALGRSLAGQGRAGAGNCPLEAFITVADLMGRKHGRDLYPLGGF